MIWKSLIFSLNFCILAWNVWTIPLIKKMMFSKCFMTNHLFIYFLNEQWVFNLFHVVFSKNWLTIWSFISEIHMLLMWPCVLLSFICHCWKRINAWYLISKKKSSGGGKKNVLLSSTICQKSKVINVIFIFLNHSM